MKIIKKFELLLLSVMMAFILTITPVTMTSLSHANNMIICDTISI